MSVVEKMIFNEIKLYKEQILSATPVEKTHDENILKKDEIFEKEMKLNKISKALERLNDAYELGDYTRDEWLGRKKKRESEIYYLKKEIYELKCQNQNQEETTDEERLESLKVFLNTITTCTRNVERNSLYKTLIESIIWFREGDNIEMKINFYER